MNVKIDSEGLRFRIGAEELETLREGKVLQEKLRIGRKTLSIVIDPVGVGAAMLPVYDEGSLRLLVSLQHVQKLADLGRSRDGLEEQHDGLIVSLQVDYRTQKRESPSIQAS